MLGCQSKAAVSLRSMDGCDRPLAATKDEESGPSCADRPESVFSSSGLVRMFARDVGNQTLFKGSPLQFNRRMTNVHHEPANL